MSQIATKWIQDKAITPAKVDPTGDFFVHGIDATHANFIDATISNLVLGNVILQDATIIDNLLVGNDASVGNNLRVFRKLGVGQDATSPVRSVEIHDQNSNGVGIELKNGTGSPADYSIIVGGSEAGPGGLLIKDEQTGMDSLFIQSDLITVLEFQANDATVVNNLITEQFQTTDATVLNHLSVGADATIGTELQVSQDIVINTASDSVPAFTVYGSYGSFHVVPYNDHNAIRTVGPLALETFGGIYDMTVAPSGHLQVLSNTYFALDASVSNELTVGNDLMINSPVDGISAVQINAATNSGLFTVTHFPTYFEVASQGLLNGVGGDLKIRTNFGSDMTLNPSGILKLECDTTTTGGLFIGTDASVGQDLQVARDATALDNLVVGVDATIGGQLQVSNNVTVNSPIDTVAAIEVQGSAGPFNVTTFNDHNAVRSQGPMSLDTYGGSYDMTLAPAGLLQLNAATTNALGNLNVTSDASIGHDASIIHNVYMGNDTYIGRDATIGRNALITSNLTTSNGKIIFDVSARVNIGKLELYPNVATSAGYELISTDATSGSKGDSIKILAGTSLDQTGGDLFLNPGTGFQAPGDVFVTGAPLKFHMSTLPTGSTGINGDQIWNQNGVLAIGPAPADGSVSVHITVSDFSSYTTETGFLKWARVGKIVTVFLPTLGGNSNSTFFNIYPVTGNWPLDIVASFSQVCPAAQIVDNTLNTGGLIRPPTNNSGSTPFGIFKYGAADFNITNNPKNLGASTITYIGA